MRPAIKMRAGRVPALLFATAICLLASPCAAQAANFNMLNFHIDRETASRIDNFGNVSPDQPDLTTAGAHPYLNFGFALVDDNFQAANLEDLEEFVLHTPPGEYGIAAGVPYCPTFLFTINGCPDNTRVGRIANRATLSGGVVAVGGSLYNLEPFGSEPGRLGAYVDTAYTATPVIVRVRDDGDFGLDSITPDVPRQINHGAMDITVRTVNVSIFGAVNGKPFWTNPSACIPAVTSIEAVSYNGSQTTAPSVSYTPTGCSSPATRPPLTPTLDTTPDTTKADAATGFTVAIDTPVNENPALQEQSTIKRTEITLPEGMTLNSGSAERLEGCTEAQFGAGSTAPADCPAGSRIGEITAISPALNKPATGFVYFAKPTGGHPWRQFLEISGSGVRTKLIGDLTLDPQTGQISSVIDDIPQTPVSHFEVHYYGGERSGLQNPPTCGTQTVTAKLTPWTAAPSFAPANDVVVQGTFTTSADGAGAPCESPQPFRPTLAISSNPSQAGAYTDSRIQIGRPDAHQLIKNLNLSLPAGLIGSLSAVPLCAASDVNAGTCAEQSKVGSLRTTVGGAGSQIQTPGSIYLGDPVHDGDIASLSIVSRAKAGPVDLGTVTVVNRIVLRSSDQGVDVISGDLPRILDGVPLRVASIDVSIDRHGFMKNPSGCDARPLTGSFNSFDGASADANTSLAPTGCEAEPFSPDLRLIAEGERGRFQHPALRAIVSQHDGEANIKRAVVKLPDVLRPELPTIQKSLCTSGQLAANACPAASVVGSANANTPLLPQPLNGPVYLVQDPNPVDPLPRIVVRLAGMASVELSARSTIEGVRTVNTFENIPDVPVSRFEIYINGGASGILKNFYDLCTTTSRADATFFGHNGGAAASKPALEVGGCKPGSAGGLAVSKGSIKLKKGVARVAVSCKSADGCEGKLTLAAAGKASAKKKGSTLGSAPFSIAPGKKANVEVKLSRKGLRAVTKRGRLAATATATMSGATATAKITLTGKAATRTKRTRRH